MAARAGRIRLVFLPPNSPELSPTGYLNNAVKANAQRGGRAWDKGHPAAQVRGYLRGTQAVVSVGKGD
jgi:hypothetical protein